jgi:RNA polymerase primary sigma factor
MTTVVGSRSRPTPSGGSAAIARAIADQARTIRIPVHMTENAAKVLRKRRRFYQKEGCDPRPAEIASRIGMPVARVEQVLSMVQ